MGRGHVCFPGRSNYLLQTCEKFNVSSSSSFRKRPSDAKTMPLPKILPKIELASDFTPVHSSGAPRSNILCAAPRDSSAITAIRNGGNRSKGQVRVSHLPALSKAKTSKRKCDTSLNLEKVRRGGNELYTPSPPQTLAGTNNHNPKNKENSS